MVVEEFRKRVRKVCPILMLNPAAFPTNVYCRFEQCPLYNVDTGKCKLIELIDTITRIADALEEIAKLKTEEI